MEHWDPPTPLQPWTSLPFLVLSFYCPRLISEYVFRMNFGLFSIRVERVWGPDLQAMKCTYFHYLVCCNMCICVKYVGLPVTTESSFRHTAFNFHPRALARGTQVLVSVPVDHFCVFVDVA